MRNVFGCVLAALGLAALTPVQAETLRCGSVLIEPGDEAQYVLEKCGTPERASPLAPLPAAGAYIRTVPVSRADRWLYHRGAGQFPAIVIIADDGRVADIEFETVRD